MFKKIIFSILQLLIFSICIIYILHGIDFASVFDELLKFDFYKILLVTALTFTSYALGGRRISLLSRQIIDFKHGFYSVLLSLSVNNAVPGRIGEAVKVFYLFKISRLEFNESLVLVFWERFLDVNVLLLLVSVSVAMSYNEAFPLLLFLAPLGAWVALFVAKFYPVFTDHLLGIIPLEGIRNYLMSLARQAVTMLSMKHLIAPFVLTILMCGINYLYVHLSLVYIGEVEISISQSLLVFFAIVLGMIVPVTPGALAVVEAAIVTVLLSYGVPREQALGLAILIHMIQFLPTLLLGGLVGIMEFSQLRGFRSFNRI